MPLVALHEIYKTANREHFAIGHFNVSNLEFTQAVIRTAAELKSPVILGASESAIKYAGARTLVEMVWAEANNVEVPVVLHLDHGPSLEVVTECIDAGFTSVMIDGSSHPLEENIRITKEVVDFARERGVTVEAELGRLGGIEDDVIVESRDAFLTDPDEAERFVRESGCDALAVAVGTSHGAYKFKEEAKLDFDRIETIKKRLGIPLVLHGASGVPGDIIEKLKAYGGKIKNAMGVPDEAYQRAIKCGINKINIDTDLRLAFTAAIREILSEKPEIFDPRKILAFGREKMAEIIKQKMKLFGSVGRAQSAKRGKKQNRSCSV